jgi:catechol 2,3-dioxygenase-like lactoylglutathione lyase family enzyme
MASLINYVTIGTNDIDKAMAFYDAVLATLGCKRAWAQGGWAGYGPDDAHASLMLCPPFDEQAAQPGNGIMVGLHAENPAQVDAFHAAALANGGTSEGEPGPRPVYGEGYYLAYVRDPDGNKLSAFYKAP